MLKLNRYNLDFNAALSHFQYSLSNANLLSSELLKLVDFSVGNFFTLLPVNANLKKINECKWGGVTPNITEEIQSIILNKIVSNGKISCVFDEISGVFKPGYNESIYMTCGLVYEQEIYYVISKSIATPQLIANCFYISNAVYHSLCVLSKINFENKKEKTLSLNEIKDIVQQTELILVGAYDAEGYVFWEKHDNFL